MNLTRDAVVATALDILDTYGLPDLTMRRIASTLGVQASALYWHFESKQALLAAVADVIVPNLPPSQGQDLTQLRLWAARLHSLLTHHRNGAELVWSVLAVKDWREGIGYPVEVSLTEAGFNPVTAHAGAEGLLHLVLGHAFDEDQRRQAAQLHVSPSGPSPDSAQSLDVAVALFVSGLEAARPC